jgi:hypothetical protein
VVVPNRRDHRSASNIVPLGSIICGRSEPEIAERSHGFSPQMIDPSSSITSTATVWYMTVSCNMTLSKRYKHGISDKILYYPLHRRIPCSCSVHNVILLVTNTQNLERQASPHSHSTESHACITMSYCHVP